MHAPRRIHHSLDVGTVALRIIVLVAALAIAARIYGAGRCNCNPTKTVGDPGVPARLGALGASCLHNRTARELCLYKSACGLHHHRFDVTVSIIVAAAKLALIGHQQRV